jgi:Tol biopolymer transport system component
LEVTLNTGSVHTMLGGGGVSWFPDWDPSGSHYLVFTDRSGAQAIEDVSPSGFSRRVADVSKGRDIMGARWAPDGSRFVFLATGPKGQELLLSNASGAREITLAAQLVRVGPFSWSPDGQWVAGLIERAGKQELVKIKPAAGATRVTLSKASPVISAYHGVWWSPAGDWILYPAKDGLSLISPDGVIVRKLTLRRLSAYASSKDGRQVFGIFYNTTGEGTEWQLHSVDVKSGAEKMLAPVNLPASASAVAGLSLHPDGKRFLTSIFKSSYSIWMLEGFDARQGTWFALFLGR